MAQKYGLVFPKKKAGPGLSAFGRGSKGPGKQSAAAAALFSDDPEEEDAPLDGRGQVNLALQAEAAKAMNKRKALQAQKKALEEDPTVFQYDEYPKIHDDMTARKMASDPRLEKGKAKKPKYMKQLLETAKKRKVENDYVNQRIIQKEREAEGELFQDSEAFVTSAYKQKLEELKEEERRQREQEERDAANDVTKRGDMNAFYRNFLDQQSAGAASADGGAGRDSGADGKRKRPADGPLDAETGEGQVDAAKAWYQKKRQRQQRQQWQHKDDGQGAAPKVDPAKFERKTSESAVEAARRKALERRKARAGKRLPTTDDE